jgi:adenosylcobinamide-phosphate synthase
MTAELAWVLVIALILDRVFGEPSNAFHPTAYLGRAIAFLMKKFRNDKFQGAAMYFIITLSFTAFVYTIAAFISAPLNLFLSAVLLKLQLSWRGLWDHARSVAGLLMRGDLRAARKAVVSLVGRDTTSLSEGHVASATVESIGESSVDGILAPLFYYTLFGLAFGLPYGIAAAAFYRATNTLDSMVGYKKEGLNNLGFFSARMDDLLNYIPARLSAALLIASSLLLGENWSKGIAVYQRDKHNTPSPNSGHPMATVAGALGVQLEKVGYYRIGDDHEELGVKHIYRAMRLVNLSISIAAALMVLILWRAS